MITGTMTMITVITAMKSKRRRTKPLPEGSETF